MIQFEQVSKRYSGGFEALSSINFSLESGEMAFLTGHSGAGKSTFIKLIALLEKPSCGKVVVNGQALHTLKKQDIAKYRSKIGMTFPLLLSDRTIYDNVALPLQIQGHDRQTIAKRVHAALDLVGLLHKEKMMSSYLSEGDQQRVGIARAVVHQPTLLLADEPTSNLDPSLSSSIMNVFDHLNQVGVSVLVATHDVSLIAAMKHRIVLLRRGKIC
ncbi:MAG: ATP-binding cassette domain-containing protein [Legionellaceae bacterium]|nr:ATP-binding cassette domain-containing protein [Legionellaceae bacterium]